MVTESNQGEMRMTESNKYEMISSDVERRLQLDVFQSTSQFL